MVRTQIYLTEAERAALRAIARQTGQKQSELIRQAIDRLIEGFQPGSAGRCCKLAGVCRGEGAICPASRPRVGVGPPVRRGA